MCNSASLSLTLFVMPWQRGCVKNEPEEDCENRPNLRRRMGTFVGKSEPGKNNDRLKVVKRTAGLLNC